PAIPLLDVRPDLPTAFVQVVEQALAPVQRRFHTAGEMAAALDDTRLERVRSVATLESGQASQGGPGAVLVLLPAEESAPVAAAQGSSRWPPPGLVVRGFAAFAAAIIALSIVWVW